MAYEITFKATDDADWSEAVELIDDLTNGPLADATDAEYELVVSDCGTRVLRAGTDDGTITKPEDNVFRWSFSVNQLGALCAGNTYKVGCTMTTAGGVMQLFTGTLVFTDGGL